MRPIDIVLSLMDPQGNHRKTIKQAWDQDVEHFWIGLSLGTSSDFTFPVERVPSLPEDDDEPGTLTFEQFYDLAMKLAHGELSGQEAIVAVEEAAMTADAKEWNLWYRRILLKSLTKHLPMDVIQKELIRLTTE